MSEHGKPVINKKSLIRLLLLTGILILACVLVWLAFGDMMPTLLRLLKKGDEAAIEAYIQEEGFWKGAVTVMLLSVLQVASVVFPGMAIQISAGVIFGGLRAFLMCYTGFVLGNLLVFLVARRMGSHIAGLVTVNKKDSWIREKMRSANPVFVAALCYMLPGLPNGIVPYVSARSTMRFGEFFLAVAGVSWIQILLNCSAGGFLQEGEFGFMALTIIVQVVIFVFVIWRRKWIISLIPGRKSPGSLSRQKK